MEPDLARALEDGVEEALAAEESGEDLFLEEEADGNAARGAEKAVLLVDEGAAHVRERDGDDVARIGGVEGNARLALPRVGEHGHEQAFAREQVLAGAGTPDLMASKLWIKVQPLYIGNIDKKGGSTSWSRRRSNPDLPIHG